MQVVLRAHEIAPYAVLKSSNFVPQCCCTVETRGNLRLADRPKVFYGNSLQNVTANW